MAYQETFVQRNEHRIFVREYPGEEPTIILMHGLPDNLVRNADASAPGSCLAVLDTCG